MTPPKTLFLDDNEERHATAKEWFGKYWEDVTWVWTANDAIEHLMAGTYFDVIFLDHDLGGNVMQDSNDRTSGMEVVRWIAKYRPKVGVIVVHSWNIPAAKEMVRKLRDVGYEASATPFAGSLFQSYYSQTFARIQQYKHTLEYLAETEFYFFDKEGNMVRGDELAKIALGIIK